MSDGALDDLLRTALKHDSVKDAVASAMEISNRPRRSSRARAGAFQRLKRRRR